MKKSVTRILALLLASMLVLSACTNQQSTSTDPEETTIGSVTTDGEEATKEPEEPSKEPEEPSKEPEETTEEPEEPSKEPEETTEEPEETTKEPEETTEEPEETTKEPEETTKEPEETTEPGCQHLFGEWYTTTDPTCTKDGVKRRYCDICDYGERQTIKALGHSVVVQNGVEPTCTTPGVSPGEYCTVCDEILVGQAEIAALGHDEIHHNAQSPTKVEDGWEAYVTCSRCEYVDGYIVLPATGSLGLEYQVNNDGITYSVVGIGTCTDTDIYIPAVYNGGAVTAIEAKAFYNNSTITSVTVANSVARIGSMAFYGCNSLVKITLPFVGFDEVTSQYLGWIFGASSYSENSKYIPASLKHVVITSGTSIMSNAFYNCSGLESICLPSTVTSMGKNALYGCTGLRHLTLPFLGASSSDTTNSKLSYILNAATAIETVVLLGGTNLGEKAFSGCTSLTSVICSPNLTKIGNYAFENCKKLNTIDIPQGVTSIGKYAFSGCAGLTSIMIPTGVTSIGQAALSGCTGLESVTIPFVGDQARTPTSTTQYPFGYIFSSNNYNSSVPASLTSVTVTGGYILQGAFNGCPNLQNLILGDNVKGIDGQSWESSTLQTLHIGKNVKTFKEQSWNNNNMPLLTSITVSPENPTFHVEGNCLIETATNRLIKGCITSVIPEYVTSIYDSAFRNCDFEGIVLPDNVTSVGAYVFYNCANLKSIEIPDNVTSIGAYAFYKCANLEGIKIPDNVTTIGKYTFYGCSKLVDVTWGYNLLEIGDYAFYSCNQLTSITFPAHVTSIGAYAFAYCDALQEIAFPASLVKIDANAFYYCKQLTQIHISDIELWCYVQKQQNSFSKHFNVFVDGECITNLVIPEGTNRVESNAFCFWIIESAIIPDSVTSIGDNAFYSCSSLTSVTIGIGVTSIGNNAFRNCSSLTSITMPAIGQTKRDLFGSVPTSLETVVFNGGNTIAKYAFSECVSIQSVIIGDSVTSIGYEAFHGCSGLTSVTIGNGVTSIGSSAFYGCSSLRSINIPNSVTSIGSNLFINCNQLVYTKYGNACYLGNDENPYLVLHQVTSTAHTSYDIHPKTKFISDRAFAKCGSMTNIVIPDSVTSIGDNAFFDCDALRSITIGNGVTSIGYTAFLDCLSLTSITIPASVTSIGQGAFRDCSNLSDVEFENTSGWLILTSVDSSSDTSLAESTFSSSSRVAQLLTGRYAYYTWQRS